MSNYSILPNPSPSVALLLSPSCQLTNAQRSFSGLIDMYEHMDRPFLGDVERSLLRADRTDGDEHDWPWTRESYSKVDISWNIEVWARPFPMQTRLIDIMYSIIPISRTYYQSGIMLI